MNTFKTFLLMAVLTGLFLLVGDLAGGNQGMIIALVLAAAMNLLSYWFSDKIVLAMYRAQEVAESQAPALFAAVRKLAARDGLPMPRVFIIPDESPNAFATGRDPQHAVVACTVGLLRILNQEELEGVLAHELSHVRNRDLLLGALAATLAGALMILARLTFWFGGGRRNGVIGWLLLVFLAPIAALLIQMAISRSREYQADASGAALSGNPLALAHALAKLERASEVVPMQNAEPSTSHLFIVNPLRGNWLAGLFSTHPPIQARIARLEEMARLEAGGERRDA